jgi:thymidylate synthase
MRIYKLFEHLHNQAKIVKVQHGDKVSCTKELVNVSYSVANGMEFDNHIARRFSMPYAKREIEWYLKGDRFDKSILGHASIWQGCVAADGGINSNYGQYLFGSGSQLSRVVRELERDSNSRRAVAMILGQNVLHFVGIDQPCTMGLQFLVRHGVVHCIVTMRSQDAIFGLGNDVPAFMFILKVVASALGVGCGELHVNVGSFHVYERHFSMLERIVSDVYGWQCADVLPEVSKKEAQRLIDGFEIAEDSAFRTWLRGLS